MIGAILLVSLAVQLATALAALRLIRLTGRRAAWLCLATATTLMAARRGVTGWQHASGDASAPDLAAETIALAISLSMFAGVLLLGPLLRRLLASEADLRESESRLRELAETTRVVPWEADAPTDRFIYIGAQAAEWLGYPLADWYAEGFWQRVIEPADRDWAMAHCRAQSRACDDFDFSYRMTDAAGATVWVRDVVHVVRGREGEPRLLRGYFIDITELKLAEQTAVAALAERDESLMLVDGVFNNAPVGLAFLDGDMRYARANDALAAMNGATVVEHLGRTVQQVIPQVAKVVEPLHRRVMATGETILNFEVRGETPAEPGVERIWLSSYFPVRAADGSVRGVGIVANEVTQQARAAAALRESEHRYHSLFENNINAVVIMDAVRDGAGELLDLAYADANPAWEKLLGVEFEAMRGRKLRDIFPGIDERPDWQTVVDVMRSGDARRMETYFEPLEKHLDVAMFRAEPDRLAILTADVSERKAAEREREAMIAQLEQKNAELERFTYTVSHDLKSPLVTISGFVTLLEEDLAAGDDASVAQDLGRIRGAAGRMKQLLDELLELSRIGRIVSPPLDIGFGELAAEAVELCQGPLDERKMQVEIEAELPMVRGDRTRLCEALMNLIENAAKYSGDRPGGLVQIGCRRSERPPVFFVRDDGLGIAPEYHERVFGLFEKLDPSSTGTGIGLAIVKRIVELHGGRIWIESAGDGRGSTFCFTLERGE